MLYPEELELERAFREFIERAERCFGGDSEIAEGTRLAKRSPVEERAFPLQRDFSGALPGGSARKAEIGELDSFASEIDRGLWVRA